jgi:hypothetical protein
VPMPIRQVARWSLATRMPGTRLGLDRRTMMGSRVGHEGGHARGPVSLTDPGTIARCARARKIRAMALDGTPTPSRRALLAGLAGGVAAVVAGNLGQAQPVAAAGGVLLGTDNSASAATSVKNTAINGTGFEGWATGSGSGTGLYGFSHAGHGVEAFSASGNGIYGVSGSGKAIQGDSSSDTQPAAFLWALAGATGVMGLSGTIDPPPAPALTGVYGYCEEDDAARGVTGQSTSGRGVNGIATSGTGVFGKGTSGEGVHGTSSGSNGVAGSSGSNVASGVYGENTAGGAGTYGRSNDLRGNGAFGESAAGTGVQGTTDTGIGVRARSTGGGTALRADGRVIFSTSGLTAVAIGSKSRSIPAGFDLLATSRILCTIESNQAGLAIQRITKNSSMDRFTVYLSAALSAGKTAKVAWFVIG